MLQRSPLQKFSNLHPMADLTVAVRARDIQSAWASHPVEYMPVDVMWQTRVIATFTRRRDARRALRNCGYQEEGCFWRQTPAARLSATPISMEISDLVGVYVRYPAGKIWSQTSCERLR